MTSSSWLDRLVDWVTTRRAPWWAVVIAALAINVAVAGLLVGIVIGGDRAATIYWMGQSPYGIWNFLLYGAATRQAQRAYLRFQPALPVAPAEAERWRRYITSMPEKTATLTAAAGVVLAVGAAGSDPSFASFWDSSPLGTVGLFLALCFNMVAVFVALVQLVRMTRGISRLHDMAVGVDLFVPDPAHAFAGAMGLGWGMMVVNFAYSAATDPQTFENPVWLGMFAVIPLVAFVLFFLPLTAMRRRLQLQKQQLLDASTARIRRVARDLDAAIDDRRFDEVATLKTSIDALERERERIHAASTWPWDGGTLRAFVSTLVLPLMTWLITSLAGRWFGL